MLKVCVASKNRHKVQEYRSLLTSLDWNLSPLPDDLPECSENGTSFEANAMEKAVFYSQLCGTWVIADDSGLVVPALGGEPGVRSARYAGRHGDDEANNRKLLQRLSTLDNSSRRAQFVCSIALWHDGLGQGLTVRGTVEGIIVSEPRGDMGFGYDPLFEYPAMKKTFAELSASEKNNISHRFRAVQALTAVWKGGALRALVRSE